MVQENKLLDFVEKLINKGYKESQKCEDYISYPIEKKDGFLIYSKEEYEKFELEKFSKRAKVHFNDYPHKHRFYYFQKINDKSQKNLVFILYNPSYATPKTNDPTINNCVFLVNNPKANYSSIEIINIYSERNPNVENLEIKDNDANLDFVKSFIQKRTNSDIDIVFAWGNKKLPEAWKEIINQINNNKYNIKIISLKDFSKNIIRHPGNQGWNKIGKPFKDNAILCPPELLPLKIDYINNSHQN